MPRSSFVDRHPQTQALRRWPAAIILLAALVATTLTAAGLGQDEPRQRTGSAPAVHRVAGVRDGVSVFPRVSYPQLVPVKPGAYDDRHYHTLEEGLGLMRGWAAAYPNLVDLYVVGQSFEGRDIWQLTITNRQSGKDTDKPAFFLEGGRHAGEISGTEACLYFVNHVLSRYGQGAAITKLVDTKALYVRPFNNPDGATLYHLTAQSLRSTVRPYDSDNDGLLDEDASEDLDGDGFARSMRKFVGAGKGNATKDPKDPTGRAMRRTREGQGDYLLQPEGADNDLDGRYNEDGIGGLDLHRNYPENWRPMTEATGRGWTQGGAGEFPLSEPETRAVFSFIMTHPNIGIVQSLDTAVPMLLRGPSTATTDEAMFPEDAAIARAFDKKGLEITGYPWAGDVYHVYATRTGSNPMTGEPARDNPLFGHGPDFGYLYYGVIWYGDEIWNGGRFVDYDKDGRIDEIEVLRWNDEHRAGKGDFQAWTPFRHPQLGEVEIGGFDPKFYVQNPPADLIAEWARNEALFNLYLAQQLAQVKIAALTATPAKDPGVVTVQATLTNEGLIPTALEMAKRVKMVKPDVATLALAPGQELVKQADGKVPPLSVELGWLKPGETKQVSWQVKGPGAVTLTMSSTRGGVARERLELK